MSTSQIPLDEQIKAITSTAFDNGSYHYAIEANQNYIEYLEWLQDNCATMEKSVTVEIDGQKIKFKDDDSFENWLVEQMK